MTKTKKVWILTNHPSGIPSEDNWRMEEQQLPEIVDGQILARAVYLSVDPYMRGRISAKANYSAGVNIGDIMHGGGIGIVLKSRHPDWSTGTYFETMGFGWQDHAVLTADELTHVDVSKAPLHAYLSYLGMPGRTAWLTLNEIGKVQPGETVVISAASGAVGQVAGQIVKSIGGRAIAIAGSDKKLNWCRELGYDVGINYKKTTDFSAALSEACPDGVDVFLDNTAGLIHDAVMQKLNLNARIIICGTISLASKFDEADMGERFLRQILVARASMQGFLIFDHVARYDEVDAALIELEQKGKLKFKTDIVEGLDAMPSAFISLFTGANFGKKIVQISPDTLI